LPWTEQDSAVSRVLPQDRELVAQQQYFRVLPGFLASAQPRPPSQPCYQQEDEPQAHDP